MSIGPFTVYAPPGVYTQTTVDPVVAQILGGLRIPVMIGVGKETMSQSNFEMVRGSSSDADTPIFNEDCAGRWFSSGTKQNPVLGNQDGSKTRLRVRNFPIVDGGGKGQVTYDVTKVSATVNGQQVVVAAVDGANGYIDLLVAPSESSVVLVTYFFHRKDTLSTDTVSAQVTKGAAVLTAPKAEGYTIITGSNDVLDLTVNDATFGSVVLSAGVGRAASDLASEINQAGIVGLTASVHIDNDGLNHVRLTSTGNILVGAGNANGVFGFNPGDYTNRRKTFTVFNGPIVDGSNGGITTTDPTKVVVQVNGQQVIAQAVDGANRTVTLPYAPSDGAIVTIRYWFNTFQDTFDYLPNSNVTNVLNVGIAPGRTDYINGVDYIITNDKDQSKIQWGTAFQVLPAVKTGTVSFDSSQIVGMLVDDKIFGVACERYTDPLTSSVSTTKFVLPLVPTTGNGRDTPLGASLYQTVTNGRLDLPTNRPDLVTVYVGKSWRDAQLRPPAVVLSVDSDTRVVTLRDTVPADYMAFATFWYNRLSDDTFTLSVLAPGPSGVGSFTIASGNTGAQLYSTKFGTKSGLSQTIVFPSGSESIPDAIHTGDGNPVPETVTVTFSNALAPATHASVTNDTKEPYDIFSYSRIFGGVVVDGNAPVSVDLSTGFVAQLLGSPVSSFTMVATDRLVLIVDGVQLAPIDVSSATTLSDVATLVNAAIDADVQVHADGSGTFLSTAPNNLASAFSFGTENILKVKGRNLQTFTNGLTSQVKSIVPVVSGQTDASTKVGFSPNLEALGSYNSINQVATLVGTKVGPFNIQSGVNDSVQLNVDGNDITAVAPAGTATTLGDVVAAINDSYIAVASSADVATYTADVITLANALRSSYEAHRVSTVYHLVADGTNAITAPVAANLVAAQTLLNDIKAKLNLHYSQSGVHQLNDTVNTVTVDDATNLQSASRLANALKKLLNSHYTQLDVHGYDDIVNSLTPAAVPVSNVQCYPILNDIKAKLNLHYLQSGVHIVNDVTNTIVSIDAFSQITGETLANELKLKFNLHMADTTHHPVGDVTNTITSTDASSPASLITLTTELQAKYETHRLQLQGIYHVHGTNDAVNTVSASMSELVARTGLGANAGKLVLTSRVNTVDSNITFKSTSTSYDVLGFSLGTSVQRSQPTAAKIAGALNANTSFAALAVAYSILAAGLGNYLEINSRTAGSTSTVAFTSVSNTTFVSDTNIGITPGVTGDVGEAAKSGFSVSSSQGLLGSHGTGFPGQTYTDATTGLRFTILESETGDYTSGGYFTFVVNQTFKADASIPFRSIPGVETFVYNTVNTAPGTTATLTTYSRSGAEPQIGDVYYTSYEYQKTDFSPQLYREVRKINQAFGSPTPDSPLSLAARLALLNGAVVVGLKQVLKATDSSQATVASYTAAIDELKKPISGSVLPDVVVPLTTDPQVFGYLNNHCIFMGAPRQAAERIGVVGVAAGTTPLGVQSVAQGLSSEVMMMTYPDSYVINVQDDFGNSIDQLVDGTYAAASLGSVTCNPAFDVATPLTRRVIQGFKRFGRVLDPTEANQIAVNGITVLEGFDQGMRVRHGLTTDVTNVISRTPSVVLTKQYVQQTMRRVQDPFIGQKLTGSLIKSIEFAMTGAFTQLIDGEIVSQLLAIEVSVDENDPTIIRNSAIYIPVFPLEYIVTSLRIRVRA